MAISLNGKEAIVEAMHKNAEAFSDRPDFYTEANILNPELRGTVCLNAIAQMTWENCLGLKMGSTFLHKADIKTENGFKIIH